MQPKCDIYMGLVIIFVYGIGLVILSLYSSSTCKIIPEDTLINIHSKHNDISITQGIIHGNSHVNTYTSSNVKTKKRPQGKYPIWFYWDLGGLQSTYFISRLSQSLPKSDSVCAIANDQQASIFSKE